MRTPSYSHLIPLLLLVHWLPLHAQQSIYLFPPDTSGFPLIKAKLLAIGPNGEAVDHLTAADIIVRENGVLRPVIDLVCPSTPFSPLSAVLAIDVSGSMANAQPNGSANMDLAKTAAASWVNAMPTGQSECALVTFDERNYLNHDFTGNAAELLPSINGIIPIGGTSYDAGFISPPAGSITVAARGRHKRLVIFLTDGQGGGDEEKIVQAALRNNVTIYCVTLRMPTPPILQNIAQRTGGIWFPHVSSREEIVGIYRTIMRIAQDPLPCELTWRSAPECRRDRDVAVTIPTLQPQIPARALYNAPERSVPTLAITPSSVAFGPLPSGTTRDTTIILTAGRMPVTITGITGANPRFTLHGTDAPIALAAGESRPLRLSFTPDDSSFQIASFNLSSDIPLCAPPTLGCSGGLQGWRSGPPTLKLLGPNGGETFLAGSDTLLEWTGVLPEDSVSLEYSTDGGNTWLPISGGATGLRHRWHVPRTPSGRCLARVSQMPRNGGLLMLRAGVGPLNGAAFSPDGSRLIVTGEGQEGELWDVVAGRMIRKLIPHGSSIQSMAYSADGKTVVTAGNDMTARLWNAADGALLRTLRGHTGTILAAAFSRDGRWVATGGTDRIVKIWETSTGICIATLPIDEDVIRSVAFSPDGMAVACAGPHKTAKIWNIRDRAVVASIILPNGAIAGLNAVGATPIGFNTIDFSPSGNVVVTAANDSTARIWDAHTGALLRTLRGHRAGVLCARFSADGRRIITGAADSTARIWDAYTGALLRILHGHAGSVRSASFTSSARRAVTGSGDGAARVWELDMSPLQQDRSDALWAIVASAARGHDVDLGRGIVGSPRDSTLRRYLRNTGDVPVQVKGIRIGGDHARDFSLVSGLPPFTIPPGGSADMELRFIPSATGPRACTMQIITVGDTLAYGVRGEGIAPVLDLATPVIDFGGVPVGALRDTTVAVVLRNIGTTELTVRGVRREGPDTAQFSILGGDGAFTLPPGAVRAMRLRFAPTRAGGTSGRIIFDYVDGANSGPAIASLFGEGVDRLSPAIEIDRAIRFSAIRCAAPAAPRTILIRNTGRAPLTIASVVVVGKDAADFSLPNPFAPATIPPGDSLAVVVRFDATATGNRTGWLNIRSDAPLDSLVRVELSGRRERVELTTSDTALDLGTLCPGVSRSAALRIANGGTLATTLRLSVPPPFRLDREQLPLAAGTSETVTVTLPPMSREEDYWESVEVVDSVCGMVSFVEVRARVAAPGVTASPLEIAAPFGSHADTMLALENRSGDEVTLTGVSSGDPRFVPDPSALPLVIPAGESRVIRVRYTPSGMAPAVTHLTLLSLPCGGAFTVEARGVTAVSRGIVALPTLEGAPGERVALPLQLLRGDGNYPVAGGRFSATIRFDASLLAPAGGTPGGTLRDGERTITITGERGAGDTLARLEFTALLGGAESTPIHLDSFSWSDGSAPQPELRGGLFRLRGLCVTESARLVAGGTGAALKGSYPNPASHLASVAFTTLENGHTRLTLIDLLGNRVATMIERELPPGTHTASLDVSGLPPGSYFYLLETPTERISHPMEVTR